VLFRSPGVTDDAKPVVSDEQAGMTEDRELHAGPTG
jgi:hypothetical protein